MTTLFSPEGDGYWAEELADAVRCDKAHGSGAYVAYAKWAEGGVPLPAELATKLDRACAAIGKRTPVLIQVNVSAEGAKSGVAPDDRPDGHLGIDVEDEAASPADEARPRIVCFDDPLLEIAGAHRTETVRGLDGRKMGSHGS